MCSFDLPIFKFSKFWFPYFKNQLILYFNFFLSFGPHFRVNFSDVASLQEISFFAATNVAAKNAKLLQKVFFAAKKLLLHVAGISAVAKSFARTINVAAITSVFTTTINGVLWDYCCYEKIFLSTTKVAAKMYFFL